MQLTRRRVTEDADQVSDVTLRDILRVCPCRRDLSCRWFFFFNDTATTEIYTLSLHDALPILMDELAQCYNVLPQLDINNTIDHRPEGDEKWFLENEKTVTQFCRKLAAERPLKDIRDEYNYPKKKGIKDECSRLLEASTM